jgi:hypothetical protein
VIEGPKSGNRISSAMRFEKGNTEYTVNVHPQSKSQGETMRRSEGNGHGKVNILVEKKSEGYVIIAPDKIDNLDEGTPIFVSRTVESWLKDHPEAKIRCALPIVRQGDTLAVHLWFDENQERK